MKLLICALFRTAVTFCLLGPDILLLCTCNLCSSFRWARDQVSYSYSRHETLLSVIHYNLYSTFPVWVFTEFPLGPRL